MLPGFRFLFAAIVLSMSILIFGLGAAALLRTAHEEFASAPTWQPAPETRFAQAGDASKEMAKEATKPVLALMRLDDAPKVEPPASADAAVIVPGESAAPPATGPESGPIAALPPQDSLPVETAKPETQIAQASAAESPAAESPVAESSTSDNSTSESVASETVTTAAENPPQAEAEPAPADTSAIPDETKVAAIEPAASPASEAVPVVPAETVPAAPEQASVPNRRRPRHQRRLEDHRHVGRAGRHHRGSDAGEAHRRETRQGRAEKTPADVAGKRAPQGATRRTTGLTAAGRSVRPADDSTIAAAAISVLQAGPVATGGPSGRPHSAQEPSYSALPRTPSRYSASVTTSAETPDPQVVTIGRLRSTPAPLKACCKS